MVHSNPAPTPFRHSRLCAYLNGDKRYKRSRPVAGTTHAACSQYVQHGTVSTACGSNHVLHEYLIRKSHARTMGS